MFFAPNNCKECEKILHELENIDDDTDGHGIIFVTTDDLNMAKNKYKIKKFPCLVLFQDEDDFIVYDKGRIFSLWWTVFFSWLYQFDIHLVYCTLSIRTV